MRSGGRRLWLNHDDLALAQLDRATAHEPQSTGCSAPSMDALDSAREVLALSSASTSRVRRPLCHIPPAACPDDQPTQSSSAVVSTSTRSGDLVQRWCEALKDGSLVPDAKEVVVRALRAFKSSEVRSVLSAMQTLRS